MPSSLEEDEEKSTMKTKGKRHCIKDLPVIHVDQR